MSTLPSRDSDTNATQQLYAEPAEQRAATRSESARSPLLDAMLSSTQRSTESKESPELAAFLQEASWERKLIAWFGEADVQRLQLTKPQIKRQLQRDIATIDRLVSDQLNKVMHHPEFTRLEGAWRGIQHLVDCKTRSQSSMISVRVLNLTWNELRRDLEGAIEFDQSQLFRKVYEEAIGTANADPFSVMLADFDVHPRPSKAHPFDDVSMLRQLRETMAAAFCPVFFNASPAMVGLDDFGELKPSMNISQLHQEGADFLAWRMFREDEDSRFVSMVFPRMLMRRPYRPEVMYRFGFPFEESTTQRSDYVWGGAVYAMGEVLIRAFAESRWFAEIRGVERGQISGGLVQGPVVDDFWTERQGAAPKPLAEAVVSDLMERELAKLGMTTLCTCKDSPYAAFYSCPSVQKPRQYSTSEATANARLSSLTNYMLCVSRIAHYVKIIARDKIGSTSSPEELERVLADWLVNYVNSDPDASPSIRAEKPLLEASVSVRERAGRPGEYECDIQLEPYHSFDDMRASLRLKDTRLVTTKLLR